MKIEKYQIIVLGVILVSFLTGIYVSPQMPDRMASHWNIDGEVDGYMPKFWGLFLMPTISIGLFTLFLLIPKIDPLKVNIGKFRTYYDTFIVLMILFLSYIHVLTLLWNIGFRFDMGQMMIPALAVLFYYVGVLTENAKRNWFIGIRTPWTLSSENVWNKTHKIGGKLFKIAGLATLPGFFFPEQAFLFILIPILAVAFYTVVYSYVEYGKEKKE